MIYMVPLLTLIASTSSSADVCSVNRGKSRTIAISRDAFWGRRNVSTIK